MFRIKDVHVFIQSLGANFSIVTEHIRISDHVYITLTIATSQVGWLKRSVYSIGVDFN